MFQTLKNAWAMPELRKKILYTLFIILIFRFGSCIPVPFIDTQLLSQYFEQASTNGSMLGYLDMFSGGGLSRATIFAMSITPYINASIILQLLTVAIPALERMVKDGGEEGRKKIASWTRYVGVLLGLLQGLSYYALLRNQGFLSDKGVLAAVTIIMTFTAGTALIMWMGEHITQKGIGNGISIILFAGIVSRGPSLMRTLGNLFQTGTSGIVSAILMIIIGIFIVVFIVFMSNAERRIPVQYAKRVVGRKMYGGQSTHLPIKVNDPAVELELLYIDDLVDEMIAALKGEEHHCEFDGVETRLTSEGRYCAVPTTHHATLGEIVDLLHTFHDQPSTLIIPEIPENSFAKKLYSTYLSYLPKEKVAFPLKMNVDARGSFTELLRTKNCGQVSVNISKPGITKGQHWHNTKWEFFMVVAGHGLIQQRRIDSDEVLNFEVSGDKIEAVHMLPGYTHNIINLSETENLVTVMWANESFDPERPDTYFEPVE